MKITAVTFTETGDRQRNEDWLLTGQAGSHRFFALADGLGGHGLGDKASKTVCETAIHTLITCPALDNGMFEEIYRGCQQKLYQKQDELNAQSSMRTTLNLLCLDEKYAYWSHIGDSRTYYFKNKQLVKRTFDHSVPQMLAAMGQIPESEIRFHEERNRLLRVLGVKDQEPGYEAEDPVYLTGEQQFLLCSDGFWELINEEQILLCLEEADTPELWMDNMVELLHKNSRGRKTDNASAIAVWIKGGTA